MLKVLFVTSILNHKTKDVSKMLNRNTGFSDSRAPARVLESLCDEQSFTCGDWPLWLLNFYQHEAHSSLPNKPQL